MQLTYNQRRLLVLAALLVLAGLQSWRGCSSEHLGEAAPAGEADVLRVVDGDTLLLSDHTRVRLIGVNAPESVKPDWPIEPFGPEASAFTRQFVEGGKVQLEFDKERTDQFERMLAYVWVGDRMLNEELVRAGLARWERKFNYSQQKKNRFRRAEEEAKAAQRGIWGPTANGKK